LNPAKILDFQWSRWFLFGQSSQDSYRHRQPAACPVQPSDRMEIAFVALIAWQRKEFQPFSL
jgi:hypothetical protein